MRTLWCKNQENPSDRISHAWAPLNVADEKLEEDIISGQIFNKNFTGDVFEVIIVLFIFTL
jgi:hypothetical protein